MSLYTWIVYLRSNPLTAKETDYLASVNIGSRLHTLQDIIRRMVDEGVPVKPEVLHAIIEQFNHVKEEYLLEGHPVFDGLTHYSPAITGVWTGNEPFTEGRHRATVNTSLSRSFMRKLTRVGVQMAGMCPNGAYIALATDVRTRQHNVMTPGDNLLIVGRRIKIVGLPQPDGSLEPGVGLFLIPTDGGDPIPLDDLRDNLPSSVTVRIPDDLPQGGSYHLRIVTRYTTCTRLLKTPKTLSYKTPITPNPLKRW